MKNLRTIALCASISLYSLCTTAQSVTIPINEPDLNKPELFRSLPDNIPVDMGNVNSLFGTVLGSTVNMSISASSSSVFQMEGQVVSSVSKFDNKILSVVVRSTNYPGALLTISKVTDTGGNISYTGRIVSKQHGDLFELRNVNSEFVLVKKKYYDLINE